jgi:hypothetical protein
MTGDTGMIELERLYLMTLAKVAEAAGYDSVLQQMGPQKGRLWLIPQRKPATTVPDLCLAFGFTENEVAFSVQYRDDRPKMDEVASFAEGLDRFLQKFDRALKANRLSDQRAA